VVLSKRAASSQKSGSQGPVAPHRSSDKVAGFASGIWQLRLAVGWLLKAATFSRILFGSAAVKGGRVAALGFEGGVSAARFLSAGAGYLGSSGSDSNSFAATWAVVVA
jgi:hypothetical protein